MVSTNSRSGFKSRKMAILADSAKFLGHYFKKTLKFLLIRSYVDVNKSSMPEKSWLFNLVALQAYCNDLFCNEFIIKY